MLLKTFAVITLVGQVAVHACMGPENVFGIKLNNGESIDVEVIENLGEEGVNYNKNEQDGIVTYSFRSHYNPSIMVKVAAHTDPAVLSGMLSFTVDTSVIPMAGFPFGACARAELDWLATAGILDVERIRRERIEQAFQNEAQQQYPLASYFWMKQDSLLPNNAIFELTENGDFIVLMANCGGIEFAVANLPPKTLDIAVGAVINERMAYRGCIATDPDHSAMLFIDMHGRMQRPGSTGLKAHRSGVLLGYDRRSGAVKRVVALP
ncbi:MAG: hypothetical protein JW913_10110 [Chitinispirillaceae bacterium]|nr:hypothetical protein [Chitinispirillaceae bacterium]